jgi:type IV pilus assembly protein PilQ
MRGRAAIAGKRARAGCVLVLACSLLAPGCVARKPQKDAFVEHWEVQAQQSQGYSPTSHPRKVEFSKATIAAKKEDKPETKPARPLPKQKVTLRMYDTDLVAVVRAMARAAGQNVVLSSSIPGAGGDKEKSLRINVNVVDAPWDETFQSILASNGLTYAVEGDIIRVMTLEDMEKLNKLKEARNKLAAETVKARELEPYVTARVEINYADLPKMYETLAAMCGQKISGATSGQPGQHQSTGETPRDITPTSTPDNALKIETPQGQRRPGQLNCTVVPDQHSNSIIIQGPPADAEKMVALIEELDKPRPQVRLKAYIVETSRETAQQIGVQWGGLLKNSTFQLSPAQAGTITSTTTNGTTVTNTAGYGSGDIAAGNTGALTTKGVTGSSTTTNNGTPIFGGGTSGNGFGLNYPADLTSTATGLGGAGTGLNFLFGKIGQNVLEAQLTALAEENKVKILSTPTITTMENLAAFVENGTDVPYVSTSQNGTNVQFAKATLKLEMTPHVVDGTNLRMKVLVKDDQVDTTNTVQGNPYIYKRETQSNLVVEDGDTIIISGLTRDEITNGETGVPYLRDIPLVGWAFKSKSADIVRKDMLIFITPTILKERPIAPVPPVMEQASAAPAMAVPPSPAGRP